MVGADEKGLERDTLASVVPAERARVPESSDFSSLVNLARIIFYFGKDRLNLSCQKINLFF